MGLRTHCATSGRVHHFIRITTPTLNRKRQKFLFKPSKTFSRCDDFLQPSMRGSTHIYNYIRAFFFKKNVMNSLGSFSKLVKTQMNTLHGGIYGYIWKKRPQRTSKSLLHGVINHFRKKIKFSRKTKNFFDFNKITKIKTVKTFRVPSFLSLEQSTEYSWNEM